MRYMLLLYGNEQEWADMPEDQQAAEMKAWFDYTAWLQEKGWLLHGEALEPTPTATTVRGSGGTIMTTDGPFAETKEQLAGYYAIRCENLDEAIEAASRIPSVDRGPVEIRPIQEFPDEGAHEH
jgi:hypothetical protein